MSAKTDRRIALAFQAMKACEEAGVDPYAMQCLWEALRSYQSYVNTTAPLLRELRELRQGG